MPWLLQKGMLDSYAQSLVVENLTLRRRSHLDSLEYRLAAVESRLQAHESRLGVLEYGRNGTNISPAEQSDTATEQRLPDASVDDDEPQSVVCSVDATDGVGSISFTEEQSAGFFGK